MKKGLLIGAAVLGSALCGFHAFAGHWVSDLRGWWFDNEDGSFAKGGWQWIDGDGDGRAECYYFDENGWMLQSTTTPDGYQVNENGAWVENGMVRTKRVPQRFWPVSPGNKTETTAAQETEPETKIVLENGTELSLYHPPEVDVHVYYGVPNSKRIKKLNLTKKLLKR